MGKTFLQANTKDLEMRTGKCVLEFRHPEINKESALKWFFKRVSEEASGGSSGGVSLFPIMVGDDKTDWNAIKTAINLGGVGVWVGDTPPESHGPEAARLSSPEQVWSFLSHSWELTL
ncbi:Trehalose-6-phosphatase [Leptospirillum ferriphilum]|nr:Trehalose-6-phosphatase [Leptospirillum ferriphilum]